jgi:glutamine synthetase
LVIEVASNDPLDKIQAARARDIRFVELQFTDLLGIVKGITIPLYRLEESLEHGTWFDGSSIEGFTRIAESDQWLRPDMDTFAEIPQGATWVPVGSRHGPRHLRRRGPDGQPFGAPRGMLRQPARQGHGLYLNAGRAGVIPFRKDARADRPPHDTGSY